MLHYFQPVCCLPVQIWSNKYACLSAYGAKGTIEVYIHDVCVCACVCFCTYHTGTHSAGAYYNAGLGVLTVGVLASSPAGATKATDQCNSCNDLASERNHVLTICQCSIKLHSEV